METKLLLKETNLKVCSVCGSANASDQSKCLSCDQNQSSPEFLAGIITTFIGIIAFYFIFQI